MSILTAFTELRKSKEYFDDCVRQQPNTKAARIFKNYVDRIEWIFRDFKTNPLFDDEIRRGISQELKSDPFTRDAMAEKFDLLTPEARDLFEMLIDKALEGETFKVELEA